MQGGNVKINHCYLQNYKYMELNLVIEMVMGMVMEMVMRMEMETEMII
jgi:hypothetical protein